MGKTSTFIAKLITGLLPFCLVGPRKVFLVSSSCRSSHITAKKQQRPAPEPICSPHCSTAPASNPNPDFLFHGSRADLIIAGIREPPFAPSHPLVPVSFCPLFSTHTQQHQTQAAVSRQHLPSENEVRDDTFDLTMTERKPRGKKNLAGATPVSMLLIFFFFVVVCDHPAVLDRPCIVQKRPPNHHAKNEPPNSHFPLSPKLDSVQTPMPDTRCFAQAPVLSQEDRIRRGTRKYAV